MKAHQKLFALLGLLSISPSLMAYTRTPYSLTTSDYSEIEVTSTLIESDPDKTYNVYEFTVKNTGNDYVIKSGTFVCHSNARHQYFHGENDDQIFESTLLQKDAEFTFTQSLKKELDPTMASYRATAYVEAGGDTSIEGTYAISKDAEYANIFVIDAEVVGMNNDYEYAFVVTIDYEGTEHVIVSSGSRNDHKLSFRVKDDSFDPTKAEVKKIDSYQVKKYVPNYGGYALGGAIYIGLIFLGVLTAAFLFIVLPLIIMSSVYRKKQRQAKEEETN